MSQLSAMPGRIPPSASMSAEEAKKRATTQEARATWNRLVEGLPSGLRGPKTGERRNASERAISDVDRGFAAPSAGSPPSKRTERKIQLESLEMPVRIYFVRKMLAGEYLKPGPCQVWEEQEIQRIFDVARATMDRLFRIELPNSIRFVPIDAQTEASLYFQESTSVRTLEKQFSRIVHGSRDVAFSQHETHILVTARIYKQNKHDRTAKGLLIGIDGKRKFDLGGNLIVIGYTYANKKRPIEESKRYCDITATYHPDIDVLGLTMAHELGHSLHLRHFEDSGEMYRKATDSERQTNLMRRSVELIDADLTHPKNPSDYQILPEQAELARRYGRCRRRFRNAPSSLKDKCDIFFKELELN